MKKKENDEVLFHHRYATSTINIRNACHPFSTKDRFDYQYVGVHNGVVQNDKKLREEHQKLGIEYVSTQPNGTFNDSEALIYDLARYFEGEVDHLEASGSIAFIMVKRDYSGKPLQLLFGRNDGNPLVMKKTQYSLTLSSLGEGDSIPVNTLHIFDYETKEIRTRPFNIPRWSYNSYNYPYSTNKGGTGRTSPATFRKHTTISTSRKAVAERNINDVLSDREQDELELLSQLSVEFETRTGDKEDIAMAILEDNNGRYESAAVTAMMEAGEAEQEINAISKWINKEEDEETVASLVTYLTKVTVYKNVLESIADDYYAIAKESEKEKEEEANKAFGFQPNQATLPSTVLRNNNTELSK